MSPEAVALPLDGELPNDDVLNAGRYVLARQIVAVAKLGRLDSVPNMHEFLKELTSMAASGPKGYLTVSGLDPLPSEIIGDSALRATYARSSVQPEDGKPAER